MISSLEELVAGAIDEGARTQISEAVQCYQSGAYRAAIVAAYVSVCFDLIQKMKFLAAAGDGIASAAVGELERLQNQQDNNDPVAISGLLNFERTLLETFRDRFGFFGSHEFEELQRLRSDRNRCAHPTFLKNSDPYRPSAELARLHIRNALALVLNQHPRQGRAALSSLESVVLSSYFPKATADVVKVLKGTELLRGKPALINGFVDELCFGFATVGHVYYAKAGAIPALKATIEIHRAVALPRLTRNLNKLLNGGDSKLISFGSTTSLLIPEAGEALNDSAKVTVRAWLQDPKPMPLGTALSKALKIEWLRPAAINAIPELTASDINSVPGKVPPEIVSHAAYIYSNVKNWNAANFVATECIIPLSHLLTENDLRLIFEKAALGEADLLGSHGFKELVQAICEEGGGRKMIVERLLNEFGLGEYIAPEDPEGKEVHDP